MLASIANLLRTLANELANTYKVAAAIYIQQLLHALFKIKKNSYCMHRTHALAACLLGHGRPGLAGESILFLSLPLRIGSTAACVGTIPLPKAADRMRRKARCSDRLLAAEISEQSCSGEKPTPTCVPRGIRPAGAATQ